MAPDPWRALEKEVANLYRAASYDVKEDTELAGSQIDVLAVKPQAGGTPHRIAVEVKHTEALSLPLREVQDFLTVARHVLSSGDASSAVLITNGKFTKASTRAAEGDSRIRLMTLTELQDSIIMDSEVLKRRLERYHGERITSRFIDLGLTPRWTAKGNEKDLPRKITQIASTLGGGEPIALAILADYGAGKTTAIDRVWSEITEEVLNGNTALVPIVFRLKDLTAYSTLPEFILATLARELGTHMSIESFWEWTSRGRFALLLDGFDEIMVQPTKAERAAHLIAIGSLFLSNSPSLLSTRPSYFADHKEYQELINRSLQSGGVYSPRNTRQRVLGIRATQGLAHLRSRSTRGTTHDGSRYHAMSLDLLTSDQIDEYLNAHRQEFAEVGVEDPTDARRYMDQVYDLSDLIQRPLLIEMLVELIIRGSLDVYSQTDQMSAAEIYELYAELRLSDDWERGDRSSGLNSIMRRQFAEIAAWEMNKQKTLEFTPAAARTLVGKLIKAKRDEPEASYERALSDLRTCSFLTIDDLGNLKFIHKSFMEYFLAWKLVDAMSGRVLPISLINTEVPDESIYFLGSIALPSHRLPFARTLRNLLRKALHELLADTSAASIVGNSNVLGALMHADPLVASVRFGSAKPCSNSWTSREFRDCYFDDLDIGIVALERLELASNTVAHSVTLVGSCNSLVVEDSEVNRIVQRGRLDQASFRRSKASLELIAPPSHTQCIVGVDENSIASIDVSDWPVEFSLEISCDDSAATVATGSDLRRVACSNSRLILGRRHRGATIPYEVVWKNSVCAVEYGPLSRNFGDNGLQATVDGIISSCLLIIDSRLPLDWLESVRIENCLFLGGHTPREDPFGERIERIIHDSGSGVLTNHWIAIEETQGAQMFHAATSSVWVQHRARAESDAPELTEFIDHLIRKPKVRIHEAMVMLSDALPAASRSANWNPRDFLELLE